jgi:hypothetical protein
MRLCLHQQGMSMGCCFELSNFHGFPVPAMYFSLHKIPILGRMEGGWKNYGGKERFGRMWGGRR